MRGLLHEAKLCLGRLKYHVEEEPLYAFMGLSSYWDHLLTNYVTGGTVLPS